MKNKRNRSHKESVRTVLMLIERMIFFVYAWPKCANETWQVRKESATVRSTYVSPDLLRIEQSHSYATHYSLSIFEKFPLCNLAPGVLPSV